MELADVETLIQNALGLDLEGGDSLKVVDVKFQRQAQTPLDEDMAGGLDFVAIARQASLGIMAICALLVLRIFRGAKKKATAEAAAELAGTEGPAGLLPAQAENSPSLVLRRQIAGALQQNPERVKQLFASWIEEKGD